MLLFLKHTAIIWWMTYDPYCISDVWPQNSVNMCKSSVHMHAHSPIMQNLHYFICQMHMHIKHLLFNN